MELFLLIHDNGMEYEQHCRTEIGVFESFERAASYLSKNRFFYNEAEESFERKEYGDYAYIDKYQLNNPTENDYNPILLEPKVR